MIKEEHTRMIAAGIPDSKLVFIKGNHFIANKNAEEFNRVVLEFMLEAQSESKVRVVGDARE